jgi:hypothetical protein
MIDKKMAAVLPMRGRHGGRSVACRALETTGDELVSHQQARAFSMAVLYRRSGSCSGADGQQVPPPH